MVKPNTTFIGLTVLVATVVIAAAAAARPPEALRNVSPPTVAGDAREGAVLTASEGKWKGKPKTFGYQWQRCDANGNGCGGISGATSRTYRVGAADVGHRLRVAVTATNESGSATAVSAATSVVSAAAPPPKPKPNPKPAPAPRANRAPTIVILSARFLGRRVYVRFRACDDSRKNLTILERDSKPGVLAYRRTFTTLVPPLPCGAYSRSWIPAPRFRHGRLTITLWARDKSGATSAPASRLFVR
jgi:hypothetical protein